MPKLFRMYSTLAGLSLLIFLLAGQYGCVATRSEVSSVEDRTAQIQADLERLQSEMDERLKAVERLDGNYDFNNSLLSDRRALQRILHAIVTVETRTIFQTLQTSERIIQVSRGTGIVLGDYVLTLDHVVTEDNLDIRSPFGEIRVPSRRIGAKTFLVVGDKKIRLKQLLREPALDIALFEVSANNLDLPSLPCPLGDSDNLTVGNFVYVVGNPLNSGINMREGIVSSLTGLEGVGEKIPISGEKLFVISNGVLPGDSGGPVLGLRDGVPELVGLVQGTLGNTRIGWAIKIDPIVEALAAQLGDQPFCKHPEAGTN